MSQHGTGISHARDGDECNLLTLTVKLIKGNMFQLQFRKKKNIAVFIDGPNLIRKEFNVNLADISKKLERFGRIMIAKVFLNQYAPEKLIEAITNQGFEPVVVLAEKGEKSDVDVAMAVSAMEAVYDPNVHIIVLGTRDADFIPVIRKAKEKDKETIVIAANSAFSAGLKKVADRVIILK